MTTPNDSDQPAAQNATPPARRSNPFEGQYGLPAPEGWVSPYELAQRKEREQAGTHAAQPTPQSHQPVSPTDAGANSPYIANGAAYSPNGTTTQPGAPTGNQPAQPVGSDSNWHPGMTLDANRSGSFTVARLDDPYVMPTLAQVGSQRPQASNNWYGLNTLSAMWGRGWSLWRLNAGPLTLAFLLYVLLPYVVFIFAVPGLMSVLTSVDVSTAGTPEAQREIQNRLLKAGPSLWQYILNALLLVVGSIPFTNGLATMTRVGKTTFRDFCSFRHATAIGVIGLGSIALSINDNFVAFGWVYSMVTLFAGYTIARENLTLGAGFMRGFQVATSNMRSILGLLLLALFLLIGGALGLGMIGAIIGALLSGLIGTTGAIVVAFVFSMGGLVITYPAWLAMIAAASVRAGKRTDFMREMLLQARNK